MPPNRSFPWAIGKLAFAAVFLLAAPACRADLLKIAFDPNRPVITGIDGTLNYTAATGEFKVRSFPVVISGPNIPAPGNVGFFDLTIPSTTTIDLFVNQNGTFAHNGTGLEIDGGVDLDGDGINDATGVLLTGTIIDFGAEPPGLPTRAFNGVFTITGGALTENVTLSGGGSVFGGFPAGAQGAFFVFAEDVTGGTLGDFTRDFSSDTGKDNEGVLLIPEPSAWALWVFASLGMVGIAVLRPRKSAAPVRV